MSHFAQIDENNIVVQVLAIEKDVVDTGAFGDPARLIQTSYNTKGGVHYGPDGQPDGGKALRKNYAGIGYTYDSVLDAFVPPKPFSNWLLNTDTCDWEAPIPYPADGKVYRWNEETQSWVEYTGE
jgi:hypothetical protein